MLNLVKRSRIAWVVFVLCSLFGSSLLSAATGAPPAEATLEFSFRPIFTFRATYAGATPEVRALRAH